MTSVYQYPQYHNSTLRLTLRKKISRVFDAVFYCSTQFYFEKQYVVDQRFTVKVWILNLCAYFSGG